MVLMKALEPYNPWFYEEIVQALNVDVMAELARKTHIPIATGERIFTKWGSREIIEKRAAVILQPDGMRAGLRKTPNADLNQDTANENCCREHNEVFHDATSA